MLAILSAFCVPFLGYCSEPPKGNGDKVAFDAFNTNKHGWNEPPTLSPYSGTSSGIAPVRPTPSAGILYSNDTTYNAVCGACM